MIQRAIRRALAKYRLAKMKRVRRMNSYIQAEKERAKMREEDLGKEYGVAKSLLYHVPSFFKPTCFRCTKLSVSRADGNHHSKVCALSVVSSTFHFKAAWKVDREDDYLCCGTANNQVTVASSQMVHSYSNSNFKQTHTNRVVLQRQAARKQIEVRKMHQAATKLQAIYRGRVARKLLKSLKKVTY